MKKIALELESLAVESFATGTEDEGRGTVVGHQQTANNNCYNTNGRSCYRTGCCPKTDVC